MNVWLWIDRREDVKRLDVHIVVQPKGLAAPDPRAELLAEEVTEYLAREIAMEAREHFHAKFGPGCVRPLTYRTSPRRPEKPSS